MNFKKKGKLNMEKLNIELNKKLNDEFETYKKKVIKKSPEEIINTAYELTVKEEIKDLLTFMNLDDREVKMLLKENNLLDYFYEDWLDTDVPLSDSIEMTIEDSLINLTKFYNRKNNSNRERN